MASEWRYSGAMRNLTSAKNDVAKWLFGVSKVAVVALESDYYARVCFSYAEYGFSATTATFPPNKGVYARNHVVKWLF
jgi:hypothetical protein